MTATANLEPPADETYEVAGNRLTLIEEAPAMRDSLLSLIGGASQSLRLLYYIYAADASGRAVRDALLEACGRDVSVTLIVDGFGSDADDDFFAPLTDAGAAVCRFHPRFGRRYLLRNHQKLALADGARVLVGGFNIEDSYFAGVEEGGWRDLGLLVDGPAAARLASYFDALAAWTRTDQAPVRNARRQLKRWSDEEGAVRWLLGGPTRHLSPWAQTIKRELERAKRFWMIAAYFAPGPFMLRRIEKVGRRGDARVITAGKSDNGATIGAARFLYRGLLKKRVRVMEYQPTKLHTKLFVIDDVVHIGSANFDVRSLYLNMELMLRIEDAAFAARMRRYFEQESERSRSITLDEVSGWRTFTRRMRWGAAYFLVAVADYTITRRLNVGLTGREL